MTAWITGGIASILLALVIISLVIGMNGYIAGQTYRERVQHIQGLAGNRWEGKRFRHRMREIDAKSTISRLVLLTLLTFSMALVLLVDLTGFHLGGWLLSAILFAALMRAQLRWIEVIRESLNDTFCLGDYIGEEAWSLLLDLDDDELVSGDRCGLRKHGIVAPEELEPLFAMDELLLRAIKARKQLKEKMALEEEDRLWEAYLSSRESLKPLLYAVLLSIGYEGEEQARKKLRNYRLRGEANTLRNMAMRFTWQPDSEPEESHGQWERWLLDETLSPDIRAKAKGLLTQLDELAEQVRHEEQRE